jgi:predicted MFS family arabinose efflux permease
MTFVDSAFSLGEVVGPMLAGLLLALTGIPGMLAARAILSLATEVHAVWIFKHKRPAPVQAMVPETVAA